MKNVKGQLKTTKNKRTDKTPNWVDPIFSRFKYVPVIQQTFPGNTETDPYETFIFTCKKCGWQIKLQKYGNYYYPNDPSFGINAREILRDHLFLDHSK